MIYIFREEPTEGGTLLKDHLKALRAPARRARHRGVPLRAGDIVVNWGHRYGPTPKGVVTLNGGLTGRDKLAELLALQEKVRVPEISMRPKEGYIGRTLHHEGGADLLRPPARPAYYVKRLEFTREFRVHVFKGSSLRVGLKVPMEGKQPHAWIRSRAAGWRLSYGPDAQDAIRQRVRDAAKASLEALGLDFGAVDIGVLKDGVPVVLEVNSAPGLDNATAHRYAERILGKEHTPLAD